MKYRQRENLTQFWIFEYTTLWEAHWGPTSDFLGNPGDYFLAEVVFWAEQGLQSLWYSLCPQATPA